MNTASLLKAKLNLFISGTILIVLFVFGTAPNSFGQSDLDSLFKSDDLLYIDLYSDFKGILDTRWNEDSARTGGETEYYEAKILYGEEGIR